MSELPGQNKELEVLRSEVANVLRTVDANLRKTIIRELFTEEFKDVLSPETQQVLQGLSVFDNTAPMVSEEETAEQKTERLLRGVVRAEFDSFQEYSFVSLRSGKGFVSTKTNELSDSRIFDYDGHRIGDREDDMVPYPQDLIDSKIGARSCLISISVARLIDPELLKSNMVDLRNSGELYCVVGSKGGKVIIQGGGDLHVDRARRPNPSSFKLVFDSVGSADEYINWLVIDPKNAYGFVLRRAMGSYDEQGNFKQALIPPKNFYNPFPTTLARVIVKDYRHDQPVVLKNK